ncbi:HAD family hydrolase [Kineococcus gynurae]|uniref:HAD family hydrolase n=1 Tax=Kineococcus gynurae TaxID=452979 RepID=A0ABV5LSH3_9ACTN
MEEVPTLLVALDVDGTVLDHDGRLSDRVRDAVRRTAKDGAAVVIATGRSLPGTLPVVQRLGLQRGFVVCANGALTVELDLGAPDGHRIVEHHTFDPSVTVRLLRETLPTGLFAVEVPGRGVLASGPFPDGELAGEVEIVPFEELFAQEVMRVVVRSPEHTSEEFLRLVDTVGLKGLTYAVGWSAWLDLMPEGITKASALEDVRLRLGVPRSGTVAVGDGRNDLEMLAWAARGVAMGNASADVRAAADEVCAPVGEDGVADVLDSLGAAGAAPA